MYLHAFADFVLLVEGGAGGSRGRHQSLRSHEHGAQET